MLNIICYSFTTKTTSMACLLVEIL